MTTTYWVPTVGNAPLVDMNAQGQVTGTHLAAPLPVNQGGSGGTTSQVWLPGDDGFLGAESDPAAQSGGGVLIAGTLYLQRLNVKVATTITNLWFGVQTIGAGASTGTFVGLYTAGGTLLSGSADMAANFTGTTGYKSCALTTPQAVAAGTIVYSAVLCNLATTQVSLFRQANTLSADPQAVVSAGTQRWGAFAATGTALPGSLTMASMAGTAFTFVALWN